MPRSRIQRLAKELTDVQRQIAQADIRKDPLVVVQAGLTDGSDNWTVVLLGPCGSPYAGGLFCIDISFPHAYCAFRQSFPVFKFRTPIYHPNIDRNGVLNLDDLEDYSPAILVWHCLLHISNILSAPRWECACVQDIAEEFSSDEAAFLKKAQECTQKHAIKPSPHLHVSLQAQLQMNLNTVSCEKLRSSHELENQPLRSHLNTLNQDILALQTHLAQVTAEKNLELDTLAGEKQRLTNQLTEALADKEALQMLLGDSRAQLCDAVHKTDEKSFQLDTLTREKQHLANQVTELLAEKEALQMHVGNLQAQLCDAMHKTVVAQDDLAKSTEEKHGLHEQLLQARGDCRVFKNHRDLLIDQVVELKRQSDSLRGQYCDLVERREHGSVIQECTEFEDVAHGAPRIVNAPEVLANSSCTETIERISKVSETDAESLCLDSWAVLSAKSAPAGGEDHCLLESAQLRTPNGTIEAKDLCAGMELLSWNGQKVCVENSQTLPEDRLRDFIEVKLERGAAVEATSDHLIEACVTGMHFHAVSFGELRPDMYLRTDCVHSEEGRTRIVSVQRHNNKAAAVVHVTLNPRKATVLLMAGRKEAVSIFASWQSQVEYRVNMLQGTYDCIEIGSDVSSNRAKTQPVPTVADKGVLVGSQAFPASRGSVDHPLCAGACAHFKKGFCKFGMLCVDCHARGCAKSRTRANKRGIKRRLASKAKSSVGKE